MSAIKFIDFKRYAKNTLQKSSTTLMCLQRMELHLHVVKSQHAKWIINLGVVDAYKMPLLFLYIFHCFYLNMRKGII